MAGDEPFPEEIGGYVLAGGKSSRMGTDKALLELGGTPLVRHAVKKLQRVCMDVRVLSDNPEFEPFAPLVHDLHPGCGPIGGMEAALTHSAFAWNLFLAVDMPFLPTALIRDWIGHSWLRKEDRGARIRMFLADGHPQPSFCLVHREVRPFLTAAIERGDFKLMPVFRSAGEALARQNGFPPDAGLWCVPMTGYSADRGPGNRLASWCFLSEAQQHAQALWFTNLNTPEDLSKAERHLDALET